MKQTILTILMVIILGMMVSAETYTDTWDDGTCDDWIKISGESGAYCYAGDNYLRCAGDCGSGWVGQASSFPINSTALPITISSEYVLGNYEVLGFRNWTDYDWTWGSFVRWHPPGGFVDIWKYTDPGAPVHSCSVDLFALSNYPLPDLFSATFNEDFSIDAYLNGNLVCSYQSSEEEWFQDTAIYPVVLAHDGGELDNFEVSYTVPPPYEELVIGTSTNENVPFAGEHFTAGYLKSAQTFTVNEQMTIYGTKHWLNTYGSPNEITITLRDDFDGTVLATASKDAGEIINQNFNYFWFDSPYNITAGTYYIQIDSLPVANPGDVYYSSAITSNDYLGGVAHIWIENLAGEWETVEYYNPGQTDFSMSIFYEEILCTPIWECTGYSDVCVMFKADCDEVTDANECGETYTGNYSEFPQGTCGTTSQSTGAAHQQVIAPQSQQTSESQGTAFSIVGGEKFNLWAWIDSIILKIRTAVGLEK